MLDHLPIDHSLLDHLPPVHLLPDHSLLDHCRQIPCCKITAAKSLAARSPAARLLAADNMPQGHSLLEHMPLYYLPPPRSLAVMLLAAQTLPVGSYMYVAKALGNHVRARQGGEYMSGVFTGYEFSPEHGDVSCFWRCQCQKEHNLWLKRQ